MDIRITSILSQPSVVTKQFYLTGVYVDKYFDDLIKNNSATTTSLDPFINEYIFIMSKNKLDLDMINNIPNQCKILTSILDRSIENLGVKTDVVYDTSQLIFYCHGFVININDINTKTLKLTESSILKLSDHNNVKLRRFFVSKFVVNNWKFACSYVQGVYLLINGNDISTKGLEGKIDKEWIFSTKTDVNKDSNNNKDNSNNKDKDSNINNNSNNKDNNNITTITINDVKITIESSNMNSEYYKKVIDIVSKIK